jgi:hypothetical protein
VERDKESSGASVMFYLKFSKEENPLTKSLRLSKLGISIIFNKSPEASSGRHSFTKDSISVDKLTPNSTKKALVSVEVSSSLLKSQKLETINELNIKNKDINEKTNVMNPRNTKHILTNPIFLLL